MVIRCENSTFQKKGIFDGKREVTETIQKENLRDFQNHVTQVKQPGRSPSKNVGIRERRPIRHPDLTRGPGKEAARMLRMRARRYARLGLSHGSERRMTRRREERNPIGLQRSNPLANNMLRPFVSPEIEIRYTGRILKTASRGSESGSSGPLLNTSGTGKTPAGRNQQR